MPDPSFSPRPASPDLDPIWTSLRSDAERTAQCEPALASFLHATVLAHDTLEHALVFHLSQKLGSEAITALSLRQTVDQAVHGDETVGAAVRADLSAVFERDPACTSYLEPFLYFKGFQAIQAYRVAHWLWGHERRISSPASPRSTAWTFTRRPGSAGGS